MKLIFATHNPGKIEEMKAILFGLPISVVSAQDTGVTEEPPEDGASFAENALKKARFVSEKTGEWAVADDSGICIEALGGKPGVLSARWAGENVSGEDIVKHTLKQLDGVPKNKRSAWFESAAALVSPKKEHWIFSGKVSGLVALSPRGKPNERLPYDVLFIPAGYNQTFAEMPATQKNQISHRGRAFLKLKKFLQAII